MYKNRTARGFTLVELLVVIGVVAILIALLMPALNKARQQARDVSCAANMRQALMAIMSYNNDYKGGLQNYDPRCKYWGAGWPGGTSSGPHAVAQNYDDHMIGGGHGPHARDEGRSGKFHWRGYLLNGRYAPYYVLGCNAKDYRGEPLNGGWFGAYNNNPTSFFTGYPGDPRYPSETAQTAPSVMHVPPFVWYGPPAFDGVSVAEYHGGNMNVPTANYKKGRMALITCPQVNTWYLGGMKGYQLPHRPRVNYTFASSMRQCGYAANVGFTDGSVKFYSDTRPALIPGRDFKPD
jgi:prepilin-type N-terminal cleavage/methylation domain-containing protein